MAKFFDIDDANSALPELRTILQTLRDERAQLIELRDEFARRAAQDATDAADSGEPGGEGSGSSGSAGSTLTAALDRFVVLLGSLD